MIHNSFLAAVVAVALALPSVAQDAPEKLDELFQRLQSENLPDWEDVERDIWREWSQSGSPAMDLLLERGREAMQAGNYDEAVEHLTALIDHAPDFAEGYNARATAYFNQQRYGLSIHDIREALVRNPRHFGALQGLGRILEEIEDFPNALAAYRAALALHPHREGLAEAVDRVELLVEGQTL